MPQLLADPGDRRTSDRDAVLRTKRIDGGRAHLPADPPEDTAGRQGRGQKTDAEVRRVLQNMTEEILAQFAEMDAASSQEMLGQFVSDLFLGLAQKRQKEERHVKQAEGITAARKRGVQFGRSRKPLPENFELCCKAWRGGQMSLREAANACGMPHSSFYSAALRTENAG